MPQYYGEFESNCRDGCVVIPHCFHEQNPECGFRGTPVILIPERQCVSVYNGDHFVRMISSLAIDYATGEGISAEEFKEILAPPDCTTWSMSTEELTKMVEATPAPVDCVNSLAYAKSRHALDLLGGQSLQDLSRLSSSSLKKFIRDSLVACGIDTQMRVRVLGGEIDLLLGTFGEGGVSFTIIQCRHRMASGKRVGMSDVVRLYELGEVIKRDFSVPNMLIVSTTGFSSEAEDFAKEHEIGALDYSGFLEWVDRCGTESNEFARPSLMYTQVDKRGRLRLPEYALNFIGAPDGKVTIVGTGDHLVIWSTERWEERCLKEMSLYGDMLAEPVGRAQPESDE